MGLIIWARQSRVPRQFFRVVLLRYVALLRPRYRGSFVCASLEKVILLGIDLELHGAFSGKKSVWSTIHLSVLQLRAVEDSFR